MRVLLEEMVLDKTRESALDRVVNLNFVNCDLTDVSIVQSMPNLEIVALSVNAIKSLEVFAGCTKLQQLYLRSNQIEDINEIRHLRDLQHLTVLALEANPCAECAGSEYRNILLRAFPKLQKIDRVDVTPEELTNALQKPPEVSLYPVDAFQQSDEQQRRCLSAQMGEQLAQLVQLVPFTAGHQNQELPPPAPAAPSMALKPNRSRTPIGSIASGEYRGRRLARLSSIVSVAASYQSSDFGPSSRDLDAWNCNQQQQQQQHQQHQQHQQQQLQRVHDQMQLQMSRQSCGRSQQQMVHQQPRSPHRAPRLRNAPLPPPQWQTRDNDYWQYSNMESPQPLVNYPSGGNNRRRGQPIERNLLTAVLYMLQELDLGAVQELENVVSERLRNLKRD
ncbi:GL14976 [Drosophila persimilis]|uniref:GL14976 n=1 Tax=Drosophila persimilis TaxID=7234 RepID=B4H0D6_DROPE|nr:uncharacterized protein F09G8.5 [Drosophila persimilis]EDW29731.1 GL14976 [Drosophila persimilis]